MMRKLLTGGEVETGT